MGPATRVVIALFTAMAIVYTWTHRPRSTVMQLPDDQPPTIFPGPGIPKLREKPYVAALPCGADVVLAAALPDPGHVPDREGEWLELVTLGLEPVPLAGWTLSNGKRRVRPLPERVLRPGEPLRLEARSLGTFRLRNRTGQVVLVDPCGVQVDRLRWGESRPVRRDEVVAGGRCGTPRRVGPTRTVPGGASDFGCGQI